MREVKNHLGDGGSLRVDPVGHSVETIAQVVVHVQDREPTERLLQARAVELGTLKRYDEVEVAGKAGGRCRADVNGHVSDHAGIGGRGRVDVPDRG